MTTWLCYHHLLAGEVEPAIWADRDGTSLCRQHTAIDHAPKKLADREEKRCRFLTCDHPAWTLLEQKPLCIRHAIDGTFDDDMREHELFVRIYERLRQQGLGDAY